MEAMILAAGLGSRLRPLTDDRPKALVEIGGRTLLEIVVSRLAAAGVGRCVVNIHAHSTMMRHYIKNHTWPCSLLISDESDQLLDTGGALSHAAPLFSGSEPILVHNVDILSDIDFLDLERQHLLQGNLATLCVSHRNTKRMLLFDNKGMLVGRQSGIVPKGLTALAFSGISIINPKLFPFLPPDGTPYPAIDFYIELSKHHSIGSYLHTASHWLDVGTLDRLEEAKHIIH